MATFKGQFVAKPDLREYGPTAIVPFMKHDIEMGRLISALRTQRGATV